jgi:hypothetical protein
MLARSLLPILLSVLLTGRVVSAAEPADIAGVWEGRLVLGDSGLRLVFDLSADAKGSLTGKLDSPDQGAGRPVAGRRWLHPWPGYHNQDLADKRRSPRSGDSHVQ